MIEFRYMHGAVYIFENSQAQRVKVGMTISSVSSRLCDVNDMWLGRKVTCQICGRRLVNIGGLVPQHVNAGGLLPQLVANLRGCPGGNSLPLETDFALAESYLENIRNRVSELTGSEKGSATRIVNTLETRLERYRLHDRRVGEWQFKVAFFTECAEQIELLSHQILAERLDKAAPFGEVFCCSVSEATDAVETALSQLGLLHSAKKTKQL